MTCGNLKSFPTRADNLLHGNMMRRGRTSSYFNRFSCLITIVLLQTTVFFFWCVDAGLQNYIIDSTNQHWRHETEATKLQISHSPPVPYIVKTMIEGNQHQLNHATTSNASTSTNRVDDNVNLYFDQRLEGWMNHLDENQMWCGTFKCFIRSSQDPDFGWIVAPDRPYYMNPTKREQQGSNITIGEGMLKGWEFARYLENEYSIKHFLISAPIIRQNLTRYQTRFLQRVVANKLTTDPRKFFNLKMHNIVVQEVLTKPMLAINLHYTTDEIRFGRNISELQRNKLQSTCESAKNFATNLSDSIGTSFVRNVRHDAEVALNICKHYPAFSGDFQVMLAPNGHLYHLDFDRCFHRALVRRVKPVEARFRKTILQYFKEDIDQIVCCATTLGSC